MSMFEYLGNNFLLFVLEKIIDLENEIAVAKLDSISL